MSRHFRYGLILALVAFSTCLAAFGGWRYARVSSPVNGPIVLISVDALRADRLSAYGYTGAQTPAIDALAAEGLIFDRAYSHVPQTLPSHAAMLTGRLPFETGVRDGAEDAIDDAERLLPEMLRDRGYATGGVVSSSLLGRGSGIDQGFEFFDAAMPAAAGRTPSTTRDGDESAAIAERWLEGIGTPRAFLFLHLDDVRRHPARGTDAGSAAPTPPAYDQQVAKVDQIVGRLVEGLKARGLYDQSTVIVVADHGEGLGDHGEQAHGLFVYNETVRVPLIIKPPAGSFTARHVAALVQHADLVPTVLDLAKAPVPGGLRGRSLTPLFDRNGTINQTVVYSESLFGERHFGWAALSSVTDGKFRYVNAPREELFDLEADPLAQRNIAEDDPATTGRLRELLRGLLSAVRQDAQQTARPALTQREREQLEAMGYVGVLEPSPAPLRAAADPKDHWPLVERYREAAALVGSREWTAATERFRALAQENPDSSDLWQHLARTATRANRPDLALEAYRKASNIAPGNPVPQLGMAYSLLTLRRQEDARAQAQTLVDAEPANARLRSGAHEVLARVALNRRDADTARAQAALAEAADPTRPVRAYIEGRLAADQRHYADAVEALAPALAAIEQAADLAVADARLLAAESLLAESRFSEAEYLFLEELKDAPESARARRGLGSVYKATGRTDEARSLAQ